jgi:microcystin-dependent protein
MTSLADFNSTAGSFVPPGVILPYGGASAPAGWLLCNTATGISTTTYAALFAAIGYAWGNPGGGLFNIPDLRGRFPRGVDRVADGTARDPDRSRRIACNAGGNTLDNVGSVQGMASAKVSDTQNDTKLTTGLANASSSISVDGGTGRHAHSISNTYESGVGIHNTGAWTNGFGNCNLQGGQFSTFADPNLGGRDSAHGHTGSAGAQTIQGDLETRPINANVNYIIKY